jgi:hypothetical protein
MDSTAFKSQWTDWASLDIMRFYRYHPSLLCILQTVFNLNTKWRVTYIGSNVRHFIYGMNRQTQLCSWLVYSTTKSFFCLPVTTVQLPRAVMIFKGTTDDPQIIYRSFVTEGRYYSRHRCLRHLHEGNCTNICENWLQGHTTSKRPAKVYKTIPSTITWDTWKRCSCVE